MVVAHEHLEVAGAEALFDAGGREGMAQHVGGDLLCDAGAVGDAADDLLQAAGSVTQGVVKGEVVREDGEGALGEGDYAALGLLAERAALAVDQEPAVLPEDVLFSEAGELRDTQAGIKQSEDNDFLHAGAAGVGEAVGVVAGEGFALILVDGHSSYITKYANYGRNVQKVDRRGVTRLKWGEFAFIEGRRTAGEFKLPIWKLRSIWRPRNIT